MYEFEIGYVLAVWPTTREVGLSIDAIVERTAEAKVIGYELLDGSPIFVDVRLNVVSQPACHSLYLGENRAAGVFS
jgi:hypothetical protein